MSGGMVFLGTPGSADAGRAISPAVTVAIEDAGGAVISTDNSLVTLSMESGSFANHHSTITAGAADGIATFANVVIKKAGAHTLQEMCFFGGLAQQHDFYTGLVGAHRSNYRQIFQLITARGHHQHIGMRTR